MLLSELQENAIAFIKKTPKSIINMEMGLGKTRCSLMAVKGDTLIICPAGLKTNWKNEIKKWLPKASVGVYGPTCLALEDRPDFAIINFEMLAKIELPKFKNLIIDEAHHLKSVTAKKSLYSCRLIKKYKKVVALTGTLIPNRPLELFPLLKAFGITDLDYYHFGKRFAAGWEAPWGFDVRGASNLEELRKIIAPYVFRARKIEVSDLGLLPVNYSILELKMDLPPFERDFKMSQLRIQEGPKKVRGLTEYLNGRSIKKIPHSIAAIETYLENYPKQKILIFGIYINPQLEMEKLLAKYNPVVINGQIPVKKRSELIEKFTKKKKHRVFIGGIQAAGEGINLVEASTVFFHDIPWNFAAIEQAAARAHRIGQTDKVNVFFLSYQGGMEHYVLKRVLEKKNISAKII